MGSRAFAAIPIGELLRDGYVAPHPFTARERISARYSCELTLSGRECDGIRLIRDLVESLDRDRRYARCLAICAPHTHWGDRPIVETFDSEHGIFLQGPAEAEAVHPISFVFTREGPVPYEWTDASVPLAPADLEDVYGFIAQLNGALVSRVGEQLPIPLGITIDHRFKASVFDEQLFGYAEGYHAEQDGRAVVRPVLESVVRPDTRNADQVQVTWTCFPNDDYPRLELTEPETEVLLDLERVLASMQPQEAWDFVTRLDADLRERVLLTERRRPGG
jgi:hypothetical protein